MTSFRRGLALRPRRRFAALCAPILRAALFLTTIGVVGWGVSACADLGTVSQLEKASRAQDQRLATLEQKSSAMDAQLKTIADQQERLLADLGDLNKNLTRNSDQSNKSDKDQSKQIDTLLAQVRALRGSAPGPRPETAPECRWLGRRTILMILRDDMIAADGFTRLYTTLGCPLDYIGPAFACSVPASQPPAGQNLEARIEACWQDSRRKP
jgi:hypothetical protein